MKEELGARQHTREEEGGERSRERAIGDQECR